MAVKMCYVCDIPVLRGEPRMIVSGLTIHEHCAPDTGAVCNTPDCMWRWTVHGGACVL